jgi:hypothetical protein
MSAVYLDHDYARLLLSRLERLDADARPAWGAMTPAQMAHHLAQTVRTSMGDCPPPPFTGNWLTRRVIGPLVMNGMLPIPKNVKAAGFEESAEPAPNRLELAPLRDALAEYLRRAEIDELQPAGHPVFGDIGVDGWARMHVRHFEHHLKQFGL